MAGWTGHDSRMIRDNPTRRTGVWTPARSPREAARERYFGGEPTGDPDACEMGEHLDIEGGVCLLCGEWVLTYPNDR